MFSSNMMVKFLVKLFRWRYFLPWNPNQPNCTFSWDCGAQLSGATDYYSLQIWPEKGTEKAYCANTDISSKLGACMTITFLQRQCFWTDSLNQTWVAKILGSGGTRVNKLFGFSKFWNIQLFFMFWVIPKTRFGLRYRCTYMWMILYLKSWLLKEMPCN